MCKLGHSATQQSTRHNLCRRNADVEEQISHLRAQLLRSEQDNELMRIKLEQETAEREKAQKQACLPSISLSTMLPECSIM